MMEAEIAAPRGSGWKQARRNLVLTHDAYGFLRTPFEATGLTA